jgi:hypothetical protein
MAHNLLPSEQLMHSTVRIACEVSTGSGFFYSFAKEPTQNIPCIVTNKHVVDGASFGQFSLTLRNAEGGAIVGQHITIRLDQFQKRWVPHPDPSVDLCAMPIAPLLTESAKTGQHFFFVPLDEGLLPTSNDLEDLAALEEILMIGYPNGIWDSTNNMPIFRRGITATHPNIDYEGRKEFLIDAACFPGSSGSPVFLYSDGASHDRKGNIMMGGVRVKLLGLLYAGPQHTAQGEIKIVTVPTQQRAVAVSSIPNNLGLVIKSERLRELDVVLREIASSNV